MTYHASMRSRGSTGRGYVVTLLETGEGGRGYRRGHSIQVDSTDGQVMVSGRVCVVVMVLIIVGVVVGRIASHDRWLSIILRQNQVHSWRGEGVSGGGVTGSRGVVVVSGE